MAGDWQELVMGYQGAVGRVSEMHRIGRIPHLSTSEDIGEWADLEHRLKEVHQQYVKRKIPQVQVSKKDEPTFKLLVKNLEHTTNYLQNPLDFHDDTVEQTLANLKRHTLLLMDTGPHGPIRPRPKIGGKKDR